MPAVQASIQVKASYGRLSLVDLGSLIKNQALVLDPSLLRVYPVSGLNSELDRSIIIIQGLQEQGETDISIATEAGLYQLHVEIAPEPEDIILNPARSRSIIHTENFDLDLKRLTLIQLHSHINEFVLAGKPQLLAVKPSYSENDENHLKSFNLITQDESGETDLVIATNKGVHKLKLTIGGTNEHREYIQL